MVSPVLYTLVVMGSFYCVQISNCFTDGSLIKYGMIASLVFLFNYRKKGKMPLLWMEHYIALGNLSYFKTLF
jgi:hypothetical protein